MADPKDPPTPSTVPSADAALVATIAKELAGLAGPDGVVRLGGQDPASRERTAAALRNIGAGLGAAIADAFSTWADKVKAETATPSGSASPGEPDPTNGPKGQA